MTRVVHVATRLVRNFLSWWRCIALTGSGVKVGSDVTIGSDCEIALGSALPRRGEIVLGHRTHIERGVLLHPYSGRIAIDTHVFIGPYTVIYGHGGVRIGKDSLISMHCRILSSNHAIPPSDTAIRSQPDTHLPTTIGRDVWLGAGVTVLGGVTIGDGCIVGAGAVVSKDLPANSIARGVPAVVVRQRA
jgi:acetyltransferase-like isoleucine patch superfamily enzyme